MNIRLGTYLSLTHLTIFKCEFLLLPIEQRIVKKVIESLFAFKYATTAIISFAY